MPIVLLPTQLLPFHTDYPLLVSQLRQASQQNEYIALKPKLETAKTEIATLIQAMLRALLNSFLLTIELFFLPSELFPLFYWEVDKQTIGIHELER